MASIGGDSRSTESLTLCAWVEQACLNALLNQHAWGYVCEGLDQHKLVLPGRGIRKDAACLTADQVRNILGIVENPWRLMFACAALLGLRAGEILGLRVEDVDLQNRAERQTGRVARQAANDKEHGERECSGDSFPAR